MIAETNVRVLIAEDDPLVGLGLQKTLERGTYTIVGRAANGRQAVEMAQALQPNVILMDIGLPDINGIKATAQIQAHCPTPVVVLTAYDRSDWVEQASAAGVGAYLIKPVKGPDLERAIMVAMARFRDMMELRRLNRELTAEIAERKQIEKEREALVGELQEALAKVKTLRGLLPICAACKKIRDDQGYWTEVEVYILEHSEADFTHGLCPDCARKLYPKYYRPDTTTD